MIHEKQFPLSMGGLAGGGGFKTDITVGVSGHESRNANWQDALWEYNAAYAVKSRADVATLNAFFLTCRGREIAFLLQAGDDYKIPHSGTTPQLIGTGDAVELDYQIFKRYTDSLNNNYDRIITRPSETPADLGVYIANVLKTHIVHYSYSTTTGIITFVPGVTPQIGETVKVTLAKFYVPVRFDIDRIDIDMLNWWVDATVDRSMHQIPNIPMREVRGE